MFYLFSRIDPFAVLRLIQNPDPDQFIDILNSLDWAGDPQLGRSLQESLLNIAAMGSCTRENVRLVVVGGGAHMGVAFLPFWLCHKVECHKNWSLFPPPMSISGREKQTNKKQANKQHFTLYGGI